MSVEHQHWGVEALWQDLEPLLPGLSIEVLARVDSTNNALLERVRSGSHGGELRPGGERSPFGRRAHDLQPCLLVAEHQTHGRGRMGRHWHAEPGASLTFSLALPLQMSDWSGLSLAVGAAIADALDPPGDSSQGWTPRLQLKWPNDIWLDGRKLGGILIETVAAGAQRIAVVGVGLNIASGTSGQDSTAFQTGYAGLDELQPGLSAPQALARLARPLLLALRDFPRQGFAAWQAAFARRDLLAGQHVTAGTLQGIARGCNAQGELLIETSAGLQPVNGGEVSVRLASPAD